MTKTECWEKFWSVIARAHADACRSEAAERRDGPVSTDRKDERS